MQEILEDKNKFVRAELNVMKQKLKMKKAESPDSLDEPYV